MIARALLRSQPDARLLELAAAGSDQAFAALVTRHRRLLEAVARRALLPSAAAEDAVQNALLAAWEALQRGVEVRDPVAWLAGITRNHALQARRGSGYGFAELHEALAGGELPEEELLRRTEIREALAGLAALPERQRDALLRTAVDGASHEQAALAMETDVGAIRNLVFRARTTLRTSMGALVPGPALLWAARATLGSGGADSAVAGAVTAGGTALGLKAATAVVALGTIGAVGGTTLARPERDPVRAVAAPPRARPAPAPAPGPVVLPVPSPVGGSPSPSATRPARSPRSARVVAIRDAGVSRPARRGRAEEDDGADRQHAEDEAPRVADRAREAGDDAVEAPRTPAPDGSRRHGTDDDASSSPAAPAPSPAGEDAIPEVDEPDADG